MEDASRMFALEELGPHRILPLIHSSEQTQKWLEQQNHVNEVSCEKQKCLILNTRFCNTVLCDNQGGGLGGRGEEGEEGLS